MNYRADIVADTTALLAFAQSSKNITRILASANQSGLVVAVPVTCLTEAYRETRWNRTGPLRTLMSFDCVWPWILATDDAPMVGNMAHHRNARHGLAHAAMVSCRQSALLVTDSAVDGLVPQGWPVEAP